MPNAPVGLIKEILGTVMPEIYLCLLVSQSLRSGNRMNIAAEIISINVIGRSQINWIPFALRIARPRFQINFRRSCFTRRSKPYHCPVLSRIFSFPNYFRCRCELWRGGTSGTSIFHKAASLIVLYQPLGLKD